MNDPPLIRIHRLQRHRPSGLLHLISDILRQVLQRQGSELGVGMDTIAAVVTGMTDSGVGIVRISGSGAGELGDGAGPSYRSKKPSS